MAGTQSSERSDKGQPDSEEEKQQKADKRFSWKGLWQPGECWPVAMGHLKRTVSSGWGHLQPVLKCCLQNTGSGLGDTHVPGVHEGWAEPLTPNNKGSKGY